MRFLAALAVIVALWLAVMVVLTKLDPPAKAPAPDPYQVQPQASDTVIKALKVLREVAPASISLAQLAEAVEDSPGTVAIGLAGNPSVSWEVNRAKERYYRLDLDRR